MLEEIPIICDTREERSGNITSLKRRRCNIKVEQLPYGDYVVGDVVIERKDGADFISSIRDKRIWSQAKNLVQSKHPIIAIISPNIWKEMYFCNNKYIHKTYNSVKLSLSIDYGITIVEFPSEDEFLRYLKSLWKRTNREKKQGYRPQTLLRKPTHMSVRQEDSLTAAKNVSVKTACDILKHFGSIQAVANAEVNDFKEIDGIGKKTAQNIYDMFHDKYAPPKKKKRKTK